jgi:hypothetical protein
MKRFMMLVGVAVVAAAMYVATSPASQRSSGPSAKQFAALKKQVASLTKSEKSLKKEADAAAGFLANCLLSANTGVVPVDRFGNTTGTGTTGYMYGTTTTASAVKAALDLDPTGTSGVFLQAVDPACVTNGLSHGGAASRLLLRAERSR